MASDEWAGAGPTTDGSSQAIPALATDTTSEPAVTVRIYLARQPSPVTITVETMRIGPAGGDGAGSAAPETTSFVETAASWGPRTDEVSQLTTYVAVPPSVCRRRRNPPGSRSRNPAVGSGVMFYSVAAPFSVGGRSGRLLGR